jgi:Flp pilus assembly protein CpaB
VGNRRTLIAAAAVILAAVSGIGVYFYVSSADQRAERNVAVVEAFVAAQNIPKGTTGENAVSNGLITTAKVLRGSIPPDAVTDTSALKGKVAAAALSARQFITSGSFVAPSQASGGSLAAAISDKNLVAVTISVDAAHAVANAVAPGDHVDLVVTDPNGSAAYILQNTPVLAVGQQLPTTGASANGQPSSNASTSGLITFEVSPTDALKVVTASKAGNLYLTLHALSNSSAVPTAGR